MYIDRFKLLVAQVNTPYSATANGTFNLQFKTLNRIYRSEFYLLLEPKKLAITFPIRRHAWGVDSQQQRKEI